MLNSFSTVATVGQAGDVSLEAIGKAVASVLASEEFAKCPRMRKFLGYVVDKTIVGKLDEVREYNIALAVFDRDASFDPATNTIVRVEARRLRRMLADYYQGPGSGDAVVIEIPKGGYLPAFHFRELPVSSAPPQAPPPELRPLRKYPVWYAAIGVALVIVLAVINWFGVSPPWARVPFSWQLQGSVLRVLDAKGRLCWEQPFGAFDPDFGSLVAEKVLIADIDRDGRVEVLFNHVPGGGAGAGGALLCFEQNGHLRWEHHYGTTKTFGNRTFEANYRGRMIREVKVAGKPLLLTVANHYLWYPSEVALLDPSDGHMIEEYWHPGSIYYGTLVDMDKDGTEEFVFGAINNPGEGLGHPGVGILTIPFSAAPRVQLPADNPFPPLTGGGELAYALLPLPDVTEAMGMLPVFTTFKVDRDRITVETPLPQSGGIVYYLDSRLKVLEYRFSDNFTSLHHRFFLQQLLDHRLTDRESRTLGKVAAFAAAPDGNSPAVRRLWDY